MWTTEMEDALKSHFSDGLSAQQSADRLSAMAGRQISRNAVIGKRSRMGVPLMMARPESRPKGMRFEPSKPGSVFKPNRDFIAARTVRQRKKFGEDISASQKKKPLAVSVPATQPPAEGLTFMELELKHCRWAIGERDGEHIFCGAQRQTGSAYCGDHHKRAWTSPHRTKNFKYRQRGATIEAGE